MELNLDSLLQILSIIGLATAAIKYVIAVPLQTSINSLKDAIREMKDTLKEAMDEQKGMDRRLVVVEERSEQLQKRVEVLEGHNG